MLKAAPDAAINCRRLKECCLSDISTVLPEIVEAFGFYHGVKRVARYKLEFLAGGRLVSGSGAGRVTQPVL